MLPLLLIRCLHNEPSPEYTGYRLTIDSNICQEIFNKPSLSESIMTHNHNQEEDNCSLFTR
jgi:hypothetical protein